MQAGRVLTGALISLGALYARKSLANSIVEQGADYLMALKKNNKQDNAQGGGRGKTKCDLDIASAMRDQRAIENSLHWVLDVCFREDESRLRDRNAAANPAIIRKTAINLVKADKSQKRSIKGRRKAAGRDNDYMHKIIRFSPSGGRPGTLMRHRDDAKLTPFETDGYSGGLSSGWCLGAETFPGFSLFNEEHPPWEYCCVTHACAYHNAGGAAQDEDSFDARLTTDDTPRTCVKEHGEAHADKCAERYA